MLSSNESSQFNLAFFVVVVFVKLSDNSQRMEIDAIRPIDQICPTINSKQNINWLGIS